jgi:DNA-directed RNA polymerase specialized sigma24 family protein
MDPVLGAFIAASDEDAEDQLGSLLAVHASPIIRRVISSRLGGASGDADDVQSQVVMQLLLRLRQGRSDADLGGIDAFGAYVATAAHHGCDHYLRRKYPLRWQLRNRIRYVLEHDATFALWKSVHGTWLCGRRGWDARPSGDLPPVEDVTAIEPRKVKAFLIRAFERSGGAVELSALVDLAAAAWQIPLVQHEDARRLDVLADGRASADIAIASRQKAERAWEEIRTLPIRQRQALLLNLKDDALSLFLATGTASLRAIAGCLEMSVEALADLWTALPLPDNDVAERLGCTRQQVINLRMAARKRLMNRLDQPS